MFDEAFYLFINPVTANRGTWMRFPSPQQIATFPRKQKDPLGRKWLGFFLLPPSQPPRQEGFSYALIPPLAASVIPSVYWTLILCQEICVVISPGVTSICSALKVGIIIPISQLRKLRLRVNVFCLWSYQQLIDRGQPQKYACHSFNSVFQTE